MSSNKVRPHAQNLHANISPFEILALQELTSDMLH